MILRKISSRLQESPKLWGWVTVGFSSEHVVSVLVCSLGPSEVLLTGPGAEDDGAWSRVAAGYASPGTGQHTQTSAFTWGLQQNDNLLPAVDFSALLH